MSELAKAYQPNDVEAKWQQLWEQQGCFHANPDSAKPGYSIVIPPPNVTGVLHLGHVLNNTIQDILARRARQQGKEVLWLPGTDHAGIATQVRVEKQLRAESGQTRHDLGREAFLQKVWEWKDKHGNIIINQLQKLGCSCDWQRERFTMDADYSAAVEQVFASLFKEGLIYRGRRMVNWCPVSLTALSDEEVIMKPQIARMYSVRYVLQDDPEKFVVIATTRPETIMADVAVAVNPDDARYSHLIGKKLLRPLDPAPIPVIADDYVDVEFGTGALKITPAHDKADFEIGQRHNLEIIEVITADGHINCPSCPELHGLERFAARKKAVQLLEQAGLMVEIKEYENNVGYSERADVPIEPRLSMQWFLRYPCVSEAAEAVANEQIAFRPQRWKKTYAHWMENLKDWCISRQLWWGHRIPVWYKKEHAEALQSAESLDVSAMNSGELYVGSTPPGQLEDWVQDNDVLDTWFSSWLWPFATMNEKEQAKFYPTSDLVTGPDIIFFWVARMIMAGYKFAGAKPFANVYFTSIIRDLLGRKMSKSLGNSPDPLDLMATYGADGLRFGLMRIAPAGTDVKFDESQIEEGRNFANKLYNAVRFRLMQPAAAEGVQAVFAPIHLDILAKLQDFEAQLENAYADYEFNHVAQLLYNFFWGEYCDNFLEAIKGDLRANAAVEHTAATLQVMDIVLERFLLQLHPFMPHISEELWQGLGYGKNYASELLTLSSAAGPIPLLERFSAQEVAESRQQVADMYATMTKLRNLKAEYNLATNRNVSFIIKSKKSISSDCLGRLAILVGAKSIELDAEYQPDKGTPACVSEYGEVFLPLEGLVDVAAERQRLQKEIDKFSKELAKSQAKLSNASFVERAPQEVVDQEKQRQGEWIAKLEQLQGLYDSLK